MGLIRRNILANFAGQGWTALMGFLFLPLYLRFIGAEGYGLVGFFFLLSTTLALLDAGFGVTATRQTAAFIDADDHGKSWIVTLLRTIEVLFWAIAVLGGLVVALGAPLVAAHWLKVETTRLPQVTAGVRLMAAALIVQFPIAFYSGCLTGLQQQVKLNLINSAAATVRGIGAVLALWLIAPTVQTFFAWQCISSLVTVLSLRLALWRVIGDSAGGKWFSLEALWEVRRFAAGIAGINVLTYLLNQIDKIILSKMLPLHLFGYYSLAWTLGTFALRFISPIFNAYYPRMTQLVAQGEHKPPHGLDETTELVGIYLKASRIMAIAIVPFSVWLAFFGRELLLLWTHDQAVAQATATAVALIALGTMCNGFMYIPYGLQLASGWTGLAFWQNVVAVPLLVPLTYYSATRFGLTGAALPWLILNVGYVIVSAPIMYRVLLKGVKWNWYRSSVVYPFFQATCLLGAFYYLSTHLSGHFALNVLIFASLITSVGADVLTSGFVKIREFIPR
jgi:O-antigen/teichoic acid export membrane protein